MPPRTGKQTKKTNTRDGKFEEYFSRAAGAFRRFFQTFRARQKCIFQPEVRVPRSVSQLGSVFAPSADTLPQVPRFYARSVDAGKFAGTLPRVSKGYFDIAMCANGSTTWTPRGGCRCIGTPETREESHRQGDAGPRNALTLTIIPSSNICTGDKIPRTFFHSFRLRTVQR